MNLPVLSQLRQFLLSVALGGGIALVWTMLRAVRLLRPKLTHLMDALFGLLLVPGLLLFALYVGNGQFRIFFFPGLFCGAALFFALPGPYVLRIFLLLFRLLGRGFRRIWRLLLSFLKFFWKIQKKPFVKSKCTKKQKYFL